MRNLNVRIPGIQSGRSWAALVVAAIALVMVLAAARPGLLTGGGSPLAAPQPTRPPDWTPSYTREVEPIFARGCVRCHGPQRADKGLRLDTYQRMMAGDNYGTVVIPGGSSLSAIISVVKYGAMPHDATRLTPAEIELISRWIDVGAPEN